MDRLWSATSATHDIAMLLGYVARSCGGLSLAFLSLCLLELLPKNLRAHLCTMSRWDAKSDEGAYIAHMHSSALHAKRLALLVLLKGLLQLSTRFQDRSKVERDFAVFWRER